MAKSQGFFTLRRGSTKSLTFQVLDGKQITKDRVSVVRNPKTSRQAEQRAKLLPAIRFMAIFGGIVDHSFENVAYGQKSKQHFLSMAMKVQPTNPMLKGQLGWLPQAYTISQGSLPSMDASRTGAPTMNVNGLNSNENVQDYTSFMAANPNLQEGDQLTCIAIIEAGANASDTQTFGVIVDRIILNEENYDNALRTQNGSFQFTVATDGISVDLLTSNLPIVSGAVILSRRTSNKWLRSSEVMFCDFLGYDDWNASVASYMNAASELTSPWYLNAADNNVNSDSDLNSGEWSPALLARSASPGSDTTIYLGAKNNLYGNYALVTSDGKATGKVYGANVKTGTTLAQLQLSNFAAITDSQGGTLDDADQRFAGALGSSSLAAIPAEQPDQFLAASVIGK